MTALPSPEDARGRTPLRPGKTVRLGLTGGIGSGKSTVAARLAMHGAVVIDADQISRALTASGGAAMDAIQAAFGNALVDATGALDRNAMRALVFARPEARLQLESIVHPLVGHESARQLEQAQQQGRRLVVHDIPLLVESGRWRAQLDTVLVVDCRESTQVERVMARSGWSLQAVEAVIAAQASRAARLAAADWVLYNDEDMTIDDLHAKTDKIAAWFGL